MTPSTYLGLGILTLLMIALDIWQTRGGNITIKKAAIWSVFWFALSFVFAASIYYFWDVYAPDSSYTAQKAILCYHVILSSFNLNCQWCSRIKA